VRTLFSDDDVLVYLDRPTQISEAPEELHDDETNRPKKVRLSIEPQLELRFD
jgi:hypothetical protein